MGILSKILKKTNPKNILGKSYVNSRRINLPFKIWSLLPGQSFRDFEQAQELVGKNNLGLKKLGLTNSESYGLTDRGIIFYNNYIKYKEKYPNNDFVPDKIFDELLNKEDVNYDLKKSYYDGYKLEIPVDRINILENFVYDLDDDIIQYGGHRKWNNTNLKPSYYTDKLKNRWHKERNKKYLKDLIASFESVEGDWVSNDDDDRDKINKIPQGSYLGMHVRRSSWERIILTLNHKEEEKLSFTEYKTLADDTSPCYTINMHIESMALQKVNGGWIVITTW